MRQLHVVVLRDFPLRGRRHSGRSLPRQRGRNVAAVAAAVVVEQPAGRHLRVAADGGFRVQEERISGDVRRNVDVLEHLLRVANLIWRSTEVRQGRFEEVELRGKWGRQRFCRMGRGSLGMVGSGFCPFGWTSLCRLLVKQRIWKPEQKLYCELSWKEFKLKKNWFTLLIGLSKNKIENLINKQVLKCSKFTFFMLKNLLS